MENHQPSTSPSLGLTPEDLEIPVKEWREYQEETLYRATVSSKRVLLIQAPPGSGKSIIARGLAQLGQLRTHYLTGTKQLQQQYAEIGPYKVMGRGNFPCLIQPAVTADKAICTLGAPCEYKGDYGHPGCGYYDQKRIAGVRREVVWNYAFWLAQMNYGYWRNKPELLILDEAHTVREHVRAFATITIRHAALMIAGISPPEGDADFETWQEWARENLAGVHTRVRLASDDREARALGALERALIGLIEATDEWVISAGGHWIDFRPVWPDALMQDYIYRHCPEPGRIAFLSATILNPETFCKLNGLNPDDVEYLDVPSTFPRAARPIRYWNVGSVSRGGSYREVIEAVETIIDQHPGQRGIVHTVSYNLASAIASSLGTPRLIYHQPGANRENILTSLINTPDGVLVSPSMHTGVDLPYELLKFQVICKLPFPDLGDKQIKAAMKEVPCPECNIVLPPQEGCPVCRGKGFVVDRRGKLAYDYATVATLVQTYGRIMRAKDDSGTTYLLDGNYKWFKHACRDLLPTFFTEAVRAWSPPEVSIDDLIGDMLSKIPGGK